MPAGLAAPRRLPRPQLPPASQGRSPGAGSPRSSPGDDVHPHARPPPLPSPLLTACTSAPTRTSAMINDFISKSDWSQVTWACPNPTGVPPLRQLASLRSGLGRAPRSRTLAGKGRTGPRATRTVYPLPVCWAAQSREQGLRLGEAGVGRRGPGPHPTWPPVSLAPPGGSGRLPVPIPAGRKRKGPPVLPAGVTVHPTRTGPLPPCGLWDRRRRAGFGGGGSWNEPQPSSGSHLQPGSATGSLVICWLCAQSWGLRGGLLHCSTLPRTCCPAAMTREAAAHHPREVPACRPRPRAGAPFPFQLLRALVLKRRWDVILGSAGARVKPLSHLHLLSSSEPGPAALRPPGRQAPRCHCPRGPGLGTAQGRSR